MKAKIIKNFISKEESEILTKQIKQNLNLFKKCDQCVGTVKKHNFKPIVYLLASKTKEISEIIGEKLLPSYCYTRIYKKDTELTPHTDREACEVTVTLHLSGDKPWKLDIDGEKILLDVGDAAVYEGTKYTHSREGKYNGIEYINTFLHYVRLAGIHSDEYFEK